MCVCEDEDSQDSQINLVLSEVIEYDDLMAAANNMKLGKAVDTDELVQEFINLILLNKNGNQCDRVNYWPICLRKMVNTGHDIRES